MSALRAPFPWAGDALDLALAYVRAGLLRVDADGTVWRVAVIRRNAVHPVEARRAESVGGKGYLRIVLGMPGRAETCSIGAHRLVYTALVGPIPAGLQVNHRDLNKQNNAPDNLEVVTGAENIAHSYANGRAAPWSRVRAQGGAWRGRPLVSESAVAAMQERRRGGALLREIAREFGVSVTHASRLTKGIK